MASLLDRLWTDIKLIVYRYIYDSLYTQLKAEYAHELVWEEHHFGGALMSNRKGPYEGRYVAHWRAQVPNCNVGFIYKMLGNPVRVKDDNNNDIRVSHNHFSQTLYNS